MITLVNTTLRRVARRVSRSVVRAALGTALVMALVVITGLLPPSRASELLAAGILLLPIVALIVLSSVTSLRTDSAERVLWRSTALGAAALLVGEATDMMWRLTGVRETWLLFAIEMAAFVVAAVFGAAAAWRVIDAPDVATDRNRAGLALDVLVIFLATFVVVLLLTLPSFRADPRLGYAQGLILAMFPSLAIALVAYVVIFKRTPWRSWHFLLITWLGLLGAKHIMTSMVPLALRLSVPGSRAMLPADAVFVFAYLVGAMATIDRLGADAAPRVTTETESVLTWPPLAAPMALMVLGPLTFARLTLERWSQADVWAIVWIGVGIGLATTARSHLLARENTALYEHSNTDALTGLYNHRHFHRLLETEIARAKRAERPLSVVAIDVDDFDRVNNVYGHAAGDDRLRCIAERIALATRASDIACRVGGDEFSIVMPDTDPLEACRVSLRIQNLLREPDDACPLPVGLSIGIACLPEHALTHEDLVLRADGALYWAKFHGRGQVVIYDSGLVGLLGPEERASRLQEDANLNMVQLLSAAVAARDPYTLHHSQRVGEFAVALALELGLDDQRISALETAALLHDVGMIGVPDAILRKPGPLSPEERTLVNEHPTLATSILGAVPQREILPWVRAHHERWDGSGYPDGLAGEEIPLEGRILTLCDSYEAMTSDRPHRTALAPEQARDQIVAGAGSQFDPTLAMRFAAVLEARHDGGIPG